MVDLANAMDKAVKTAYKAVMKPKEGTILTVAKGAADKAADLASTVEDVEGLPTCHRRGRRDTGTRSSGDASGAERGGGCRFRRTGTG